MPNTQNITRFLVLSCSLFSILLWPMFADAVGQRKALLVGINDYARSAIPDLRGAVNDVSRLAEILQKQMHFPEANIVKLTDQEATRDRILSELSKLVNSTQKEDILYIHFSGHGSQVADQNGDEKDGYDETFLSYDARQQGIPDIVDDEFEQLFNKLASDNVLIVFDSCHSGTVTRSVPSADPEIAEIQEQIKPRVVDPDPRTDIYSHVAVSSRAVVSVDTLGHVLMTAAPAEMQALDGPIGDNREFFGIFSFALVKALEKHGDKATPKQVHASVKQTLNDMQKRYRFQPPEPQLEISSEKLNRSLF